MVARGEPKQHLQALDGLRGIAAFGVMIGHSAYLYLDNNSVSRFAVPLRFLSHVGHPAVVLFFVLSGFVLYLSYKKGRDVTYLAYLARRVFRLYPALIVAVLGAALLHRLSPPQAGDSTVGRWMTVGWDYHVTLGLVLRDISLIGLQPNDIAMDPVAWSLIIEMRFSLLLVALSVLCNRSRAALFALGLVSFGIGLHLIHGLGISPPYLISDSIVGAVAITLFYLPAFVMGAVTADIFIKRAGEQFWPRAAWLKIAIVLLAAAMGKAASNDLVWAIAFAAVIFVVCLGAPLQGFLSHGAFLWLGRISYSLYLVHFSILMAFTYWLQPVTGTALPALLAPVVSLLTATAIYAVVEAPGMRMGKWAAGALARRADRATISEADARAG